MVYYLRLMLYERHPHPQYIPLGPDVELVDLPHFKTGYTYRIRLAGSTDEETTWPEFVVVKVPDESVINDPQRPGKAATLVTVYLVLLSEYKQFVEPFQIWELN